MFRFCQSIIYGSLHCRIKSCTTSMRRVLLLTDRLNGNTSVFGAFEDASKENLHQSNHHCNSTKKSQTKEFHSVETVGAVISTVALPFQLQPCCSDFVVI
eukprot:11479_4